MIQATVLANKRINKAHNIFEDEEEKEDDDDDDDDVGVPEAWYWVQNGRTECSHHVN